MQANQQDERAVRIEKMERLQSLGIPVFPSKFNKKDLISSLLEKKDEWFREVEKVMESPKALFHTAGRIIAYRSFGKIAFGKIFDGTGSIQIAFSKNNCKIVVDGEKKEMIEEMTAFKIMEKLVDVADFIGVHGELFITHKWELTLFVESFEFLSKALRPLPEKFHGLSDKETIYRKRYLDMISDRSSFERFQLRSKFTQKLREFYYKNGFTEVETPILGNTASGALANPFSTHHEASDSELYLRIAPETSLKKCTVGGMEKVFEIGKNFRNEGLDPSHLPEFTMVEHYAVYWDFHDNMDFTEKMFEFILEEVFQGKKKFNILNSKEELKEVDFSGPWPRVAMRDLILKDSDIDIYEYQDAETLRNTIKEKNIKIDKIDTFTFGTLIDKLYKTVSRPKLIDPVFVINQPYALSPLARSNDENPNIVDRYQLVINGWEVNNAYSELVDPIEQMKRFESQQEARDSGDDEATMMDQEFVIAMEHGMPIQSGYGMGIDRIIALLTEQPSLRDVVLFPMVKNKG